MREFMRWNQLSQLPGYRTRYARDRGFRRYEGRSLLPTTVLPTAELEEGRGPEYLYLVTFNYSMSIQGGDTRRRETGDDGRGEG